MRSIDVTARTIEEAINSGLSKLGCSISDCRVEILQEGAKGLFGFFGSKPAAVRLTLLEEEGSDEGLGIDLHASLAQEAEKPARQERGKKPEKHKQRQAPEKKEASPMAAPAPAEPRPAGKNKMRIASSPQVIDKPKNKDVLERFKNAPLPGKAKAPPPPASKTQAPSPAKGAQASRAPIKPLRPTQPKSEWKEPPGLVAEEQRPPVPAPENIVLHPEDTQEGIAQQFLLGITSRMGVTVQVDVLRTEAGNISATMYGDTLGILIGRRGETLDALQYLTSLQVNRGKEEYTRVTLDTENYRAKREEALSRLAARMANRAIKTGRKVSLEPMNPYERRILHSSLQGNPNVSTHSEGDEPYRHVVVVPARSAARERDKPTGA